MKIAKCFRENALRFNEGTVIIVLRLHRVVPSMKLTRRQQDLKHTDLLQTFFLNSFSPPKRGLAPRFGSNREFRFLGLIKHLENCVQDVSHFINFEQDMSSFLKID